MLKIETIWHHILNSALTEQQFKFTQKELAEKFGFSTSTVNHALQNPSNIGAVRIESKFFVLTDFRKLLYYWSSVRNLEKDIIYKTRYDAYVQEIEGLVPANSIFACYTAARYILKDTPADYAEVYIYLDDTEEAKSRFPPSTKSFPNVFVLKKPENMGSYGSYTTFPQTFVDLWNLKEWYSHDFIKALEEKIYGLLS